MFSSIFSTYIRIIILLIGVFVFINDPNLPIPAIWPAITTNLASLFQGLLAISLLALAISTADSHLNACSIMVSHDIINALRTQKISSTLQLRLARITSFCHRLISYIINLLSKKIIEFVDAC